MQTRLICIYNNTLIVRVGGTRLHIRLNGFTCDEEDLIEAGIPMANDDIIEDIVAAEEELYNSMEAKMQQEYWEPQISEKADKALNYVNYQDPSELPDHSPEEDQQIMDDLEADHWIDRYKSGEFDDLPF
jgi:hypothetical protein